jgi:hypothetical protein
MALDPVYGPNPLRGLHSFPGGIPAIGIGDTPNLGAFSRLRVANPAVLFESTSQYSDDTEVNMYHKVTGAASSTHLPNESATQLSVTTASGDDLIRQSRDYIPYQPGKSQLALITFALGATQTSTVKRVGLFDDENGFFLEVSGTDVAVVRRSYDTGSVVNTSVAQASWNLDPMDGTGPSGITLDHEKAQILVLDAQWLGVGRVRMGFDIDGLIVYVHEFLHANIITTTYTTTLSLPVRWQITTTDTNASADSMKAICACVISEGGRDTATARPLSVAGGTQTVTSSNFEALIAIRPAAFYSGSIVMRRRVILEGFKILNTGSTTINYLLSWCDGLGTCSVTGGTWAANATSGAGIEVNGTGTAMSYADLLRRNVAVGWVPGSGGNNPEPIFDLSQATQYPLTLDIDGNNPSFLVLSAISLGADSDCIGSLKYRVE